MNNIKNFLKEKRVILVSILLIMCGGVCFLTGCFASNSNNIKTINKIQNRQKFKYKRFVETWNNILLKNRYFVTFNTNELLLSTNNKEMIKKLNKIFNSLRIKNQIEEYQKKLKNDKMINIPIQEYIKFLNSLNFKEYNVPFCQDQFVINFYSLSLSYTF
jgi:hypothetical protein